MDRSDTAFLLHVYGDHQHAVAVSIPRDTLVTIPPCRLPDGSWTQAQSTGMFNAAYSVGQTTKGNPACTQNTVEQLTGLRVDLTVVVDFKGFARLTEAVGGVTVCVPQDVYQKDLSPNRTTHGQLLFHKGEQTLSGQKALDYVRIRRGIGDGSDIGRIKRQQAFVAGLIKKMKGDGLTPTKLPSLADAATKSMTVDPGLGTANRLVSSAMALQGNRPAQHQVRHPPLALPGFPRRRRPAGRRRAVGRAEGRPHYRRRQHWPSEENDVTDGCRFPVTEPGINVVLGQSYAASAMSVSRAPASLAAIARSADDDLCSNLSYG
ncbi:LCP family protein [Streptomyces mirabilis]|uniref:LCP family protein n=1 Tax=Streptomyces mirabilis TaxID=68239 RepID=UPI0036F071E5